MQYLASHYWQSADDRSVSLLLQQVYHKRKRIPVLMACVCTNEGNLHMGKNIITKLADWFWETGLPCSVQKGEAGIEKVRRKLEDYLKQENMFLEDVSLSGVFGVGKSLFLWKKGECKIWLLNERNLHSQITEIELGEKEENQMVFRSGVIENGAGLLLGSASFEEGIAGTRAEQCLDVRMLRGQKRLEKRLQELGNAVMKKGGKNTGAIMIVASGKER